MAVAMLCRSCRKVSLLGHPWHSRLRSSPLVPLTGRRSEASDTHASLNGLTSHGLRSLGVASAENLSSDDLRNMLAEASALLNNPSASSDNVRKVSSVCELAVTRAKALADGSLQVDVACAVGKLGLPKQQVRAQELTAHINWKSVAANDSLDLESKLQSSGLSGRSVIRRLGEEFCAVYSLDQLLRFAALAVESGVHGETDVTAKAIAESLAKFWELDLTPRVRLTFIESIWALRLGITGRQEINDVIAMLAEAKSRNQLEPDLVIRIAKLCRNCRLLSRNKENRKTVSSLTKLTASCIYDFTESDINMLLNECSSLFADEQLCTAVAEKLAPAMGSINDEAFSRLAQFLPASSSASAALAREGIRRIPQLSLTYLVELLAAAAHKSHVWQEFAEMALNVLSSRLAELEDFPLSELARIYLAMREFRIMPTPLVVRLMRIYLVRLDEIIKMKGYVYLAQAARLVLLNKQHEGQSMLKLENALRANMSNLTEHSSVLAVISQLYALGVFKNKPLLSRLLRACSTSLPVQCQRVNDIVLIVSAFAVMGRDRYVYVVFEAIGKHLSSAVLPPKQSIFDRFATIQVKGKKNTKVKTESDLCSWAALVRLFDAMRSTRVRNDRFVMHAIKLLLANESAKHADGLQISQLAVNCAELRIRHEELWQMILQSAQKDFEIWQDQWKVRLLWALTVQQQRKIEPLVEMFVTKTSPTRLYSNVKGVAASLLFDLMHVLKQKDKNDSSLNKFADGVLMWAPDLLKMTFTAGLEDQAQVKIAGRHVTVKTDSGALRSFAKTLKALIKPAGCVQEHHETEHGFYLPLFVRSATLDHHHIKQALSAFNDRNIQQKTPLISSAVQELSQLIDGDSDNHERWQIAETAVACLPKKLSLSLHDGNWAVTGKVQLRKRVLRYYGLKMVTVPVSQWMSLKDEPARSLLLAWLLIINQKK